MVENPEITIAFALGIINVIGLSVSHTNWLRSKAQKILIWSLVGFNLAMIIALSSII